LIRALRIAAAPTIGWNIWIIWGWIIWGIAVLFPAAGCYTLQASWLGGHWTMTFAAGHVAA
jgi:hypothetical protein